MKRVLITGASGAIGTEIVKLLSEKLDEFKITVLDIKNKQSKKFFKRLNKKIVSVFGDICIKEEIRQACIDQDFVIHLAGIIPPLADKNPRLAFRVNVTGTKNIIECIQEHSPSAVFIYSSSISVYGDRIANPWIKVTDDLKPSEGDEYALTKIEAEKIIRKSSLNWIIFRLTAIMGNNNHKISKLMFHMPLNTPIEIATPADTARAIIKAVRRPELLIKRIFNLSGGDNCRIIYRIFLERNFNIMGLGNLNFPKGSFAEKNFHCSFLADGDELEDLLHFRKDTIEDYFNNNALLIKPLTKFIISIFRFIIKRILLLQSEPYRALKKLSRQEMTHFFFMNRGIVSKLKTT